MKTLEAPRTIQGTTAYNALRETYGHVFRRVYGERAKSPDVVLFDGYLTEEGAMKLSPKAVGRMSFVCKNKVCEQTEKMRLIQQEAVRSKQYNPVYHRSWFTKRRK